MDLREKFRSLFGFGGRQDRDFPDFPWKVPDEENESDDSFHTEDDKFQFFGNWGHSIDDIFHHFHGDMRRQMESLHSQMEDMMRGFGTIASEHFPPEDRPSIMDQPESSLKDRGNSLPFFNFHFSQPFQSESNDSEKDPRDFMLKENEEEKIPSSLPSLPSQPSRDFSGAFHNPFGRCFPRNTPREEERRDTDLDGKVSRDDVMSLIKKSESPQKSPREGFSSRSSVTMTTVRGADGKVEHKKVVRDSSGREESTLSRSIDGQSHTVTTITGPNGLEERREDFKNINEDDIQKFEEKWHSHQSSRRPRNPLIVKPSPRIDPKDVDLFSKFFEDPLK